MVPLLPGITTPPPPFWPPVGAGRAPKACSSAARSPKGLRARTAMTTAAMAAVAKARGATRRGRLMACWISTVMAFLLRDNGQRRRAGLGNSSSLSCALSSGVGSPRRPEARRTRASRPGSPVGVNSPREMMASIALSSSLYRTCSVMALSHPRPQGFQGTMLELLHRSLAPAQGPCGLLAAPVVSKPHDDDLSLVFGQPLHQLV